MMFSIPVKASTDIPLPPLRTDEQSIDVMPNGSLQLCKGNDTRQWNQCVGTMQIGDLGQYSGEIRKGKPDGSGRFSGRDGSVYQGEFKAGVPNGKGKYTSAKGVVYLGEFADGIANGEGRETTDDGTIYVGTYVNGAREGQGSVTFPDGRKYEGEFKADRAEGYGTFSFRNGDKYTGVVVADELTDRGIYQFANGDRYVGSYKNYKPSGQGVFTSVSGLKWVGPFVDGIPKGRGSLYDTNGDLILEDQFDGFSSFELAKAKFEEAKRIEREKKREADASAQPQIVNPVVPPASELPSVKSVEADPAPKDEQIKSVAGTDVANTTVNTNTNADTEQRAPLSCRHAGDILISFVTCDVVAPQVVIDAIRFQDDVCRSGQDYLADYDHARSAPFTDLYNRARAYFYFRPFDYRGHHRYRDQVYFLVSGCRVAPAFSITVNNQEWNWPATGGRPVRLR